MGEPIKEDTHGYASVWNGQVLAESDDTVIVEGNHYFPAESLNDRVLLRQRHPQCLPVEGTGQLLHVTVDGEANSDAAWYYPRAQGRAEHVRDRVAFWNGVKVESVEGRDRRRAGGA